MITKAAVPTPSVQMGISLKKIEMKMNLSHHNHFLAVMVIIQVGISGEIFETEP